MSSREFWFNKAAEKVISELQDRSGIGNAFDEIDEETMQEIKDTLAQLIRVEYNKTL